MDGRAGKGMKTARINETGRGCGGRLQEEVDMNTAGSGDEQRWNLIGADARLTTELESSGVRVVRDGRACQRR